MLKGALEALMRKKEDIKFTGKYNCKDSENGDKSLMFIVEYLK